MRTIRDCNVAVVGGAGFLGSHLVNHLIDDRNCRVLVVDNLVAGKREFVHPKAEFVHHDITGSEEYLRRVFLDFRRSGGKGSNPQPQSIDDDPLDFFVFNYAAYPYIPVSFERPLHVFNVNAFGALKVINAAQEAGATGILQVSSAEIYGGGQYGSVNSDPGSGPSSATCKIDEEAVVRPHSSYGAAKAAIDAMVQVRWREAKTPCIALRQFNCLGERETHPYIVPEIISQLDKQCAKSFRVTWHATVSLGNNSFRDFQYAGDAVRMAVELLERGEFGEVYNLGSEDGVKMYDLAKRIGKLMGFADVQVIEDAARKRPWEIWRLQADVSKLKQAIDYRGELADQAAGGFVTVDLDEALRRTIAWFGSNGRRWPWEK